VHEFSFFTATLHECERFPNPFTPNGDGVNDYVQFFYPDFELKAGDIYIYNVSDKKVRELHIPAKQGVKELARWDGTDKNGKLLPQGVYLYVIKVEGEVMCEGTVTIAR
jgi:gliding motility-associated-like protein